MSSERRKAISYALSSRVDVEDHTDGEARAAVVAEIGDMLIIAQADLGHTPRRFFVAVEPLPDALLRVTLEVPRD